MCTRRRARNESAFTLIELLLVVVIITILATLVVPRFAGRTEEARIATAKGQINIHFSAALDMYEVDNGRYPTTEQGLQALRVEPSMEPVPMSWKGPYLKKEVPLDPWGGEYIYVCPGRQHPDGYDLYSPGPDGKDGTEDDVTNWD